MYWPKNSRDVRWNFEKFLIHPTTGYPVKRYDQKFSPDKIIPDIDKLLEELRKPKTEESVGKTNPEPASAGAK